MTDNLVKGNIVKLVRGIYYVDTGSTVVRCKARGLFRELSIDPIVGDRVTIRISEEDGNGYIEQVEKRSSRLIRPNVANIDLALIVFSLKEPDLNLYLLDKNLIMTEFLGIETAICLTKADLVDHNEVDYLKDLYSKIGYRVLFTGRDTADDFDLLIDLLNGKITALAGPSGVGKTTLINRLIPGVELKTSSVSQKTSRGRHTTRHVELMALGRDTFILDTPGFSSLDLDFIKEDISLANAFREFRILEQKCRFRGCMHLNEPDCAVKRGIEDGKVAKSRYDNYLIAYEELKKIRRY